MKFTRISTAAAAATIAGTLGLSLAPLASAAPETAALGASQRLTDGAVVSSYTVTGLEPSNDVVNVPLAGKLYEATATVDAVQGTVTPALPFFNARAANGDNYRVLFQASAPQGLSGASLPQGGKSTGKIYFDVTGPAPTEVVYNDAVQDRAIWT